MIRQKNPNLEILENAVHRLGSLANEMVFLGACATGLLLTDPAAPPIRGTLDVDVIVELTSLAEYHRLSEKLRKRGFVEDLSPDAPLCRWKNKGVILDVMPTNPEILGFGNPWFSPAFTRAEAVTLPSGKRIQMLSAPYFLATKIEAFDYRGKGDYLLSTDMEDIVTVLDGRPEIVDEVRKSERKLSAFLATRFANLLKEKIFIEALPGHLPPDRFSQERLPLLIGRMREIAK
ncbi:hypothetical protein ACFL03_06655 [Thermodesulfobacteriota bacterium]